ncbi:MAG: hypothetical protein HC810_08690 [Acaryochloridaceae cyanobacterium RL_2_7]|nr:hypothetical protein [Acaryochloridaceae cyanobacterium RL_2_7]
MNAAEQATSATIANKIAAIVNLFKREFVKAKPNLSPWNNDPDTREWMDPDSIDIGFNLPPGHTLVQLRLNSERLIGIEIMCFGPLGSELWKFSTIGSWEFLGSCPPPESFQTTLKEISYEIFAVFNHDPESSAN